MILQASNDEQLSVDAPQGGHAVILLHGLCGSALELGSVQKALRNNGFSVFTPSIPDYSADALTRPEVTPDWRDWCAYVEDEVARLRTEFDSVSICGLSMGATLALALAARNPALSSIVLLSPVLYYDGWSVPWYHGLLGVVCRLGFRDWTYKECDPYGIKNIAMRKRVANALKKDGVAAVGAAELPARQLLAAQRLMRHVRTHLRRVRSRTLVIHSVDDETASPRSAEAIMARIGAQSRRVIWLGDCYHIITVDNEREIVTNEAAQFLKRDGAGGRELPRAPRLVKLPLKDRRHAQSAAA
ncbi:MAG: carboxylesterase [Betaproteobacteria bacterium]|nr:carboxylesterase [Betaproteobacteria bacterium]